MGGQFRRRLDVDVIEGMTGWRLKGRVNTELGVGGGAKQRSVAQTLVCEGFQHPARTNLRISMQARPSNLRRLARIVNRRKIRPIVPEDL